MISGLNTPENIDPILASAFLSWPTKIEDLPVLLIVEDEILLRMAMAEQMREVGFVVIDAADGDEALSLLRGYPQVDAIFSDVRMPGVVDGVALAQIVNRYYPRVKIFLTSGVVDRLPASGIAAGFFRKPYLAREVAAAIKRTCGLP